MTIYKILHLENRRLPLPVRSIDRGSRHNAHYRQVEREERRTAACCYLLTSFSSIISNLVLVLWICSDPIPCPGSS